MDNNRIFYDILSKMNKVDYMKNFLTYLLSPVIAGVKPSSTITLTRGENGLYDTWKAKGEKFLAELDLRHVDLREDRKSLVILVYSEKTLENILLEKDNISFLNAIGYTKGLNINEFLVTLIERYEIYHCPHELGIFLGIPLEDVKAFMECSGSKCLLCGYWKVYGNKEKATKIFNNYDTSKQVAMDGIVKGVAFNNIIFDIKQTTYM